MIKFTLYTITFLLFTILPSNASTSPIMSKGMWQDFSAEKAIDLSLFMEAPKIQIFLERTIRIAQRRGRVRHRPVAGLTNNQRKMNTQRANKVRRQLIKNQKTTRQSLSPAEKKRRRQQLIQHVIKGGRIADYDGSGGASRGKLIMKKRKK